MTFQLLGVIINMFFLQEEVIKKVTPELINEILRNIGLEHLADDSREGAVLEHPISEK